MIAKKDNKEYFITKDTKAMYLKDGYDIFDDDGKVLEYSPKKTISYNDFIKKTEEIAKENEELKTQLEEANKLPKDSKDLTKKIKELESQVTSLTKENEELKTQLEEKNKNGKVPTQE